MAEVLDDSRTVTITLEEPMVEPKPVCTEGDKKPGHVCKDGEWQAVEVPEPEPEPEPEVEEKPCYIKCTLPILDMLPGIPCHPLIPILPGFKRSDKP